MIFLEKLKYGCAHIISWVLLTVYTYDLNEFGKK